MNDSPSIELLKFSATFMDNFKFCIKRVTVHDDNERNAQLLLLFLYELNSLDKLPVAFVRVGFFFFV